MDYNRVNKQTADIRKSPLAAELRMRGHMVGAGYRLQMASTLRSVFYCPFLLLDLYAVKMNVSLFPHKFGPIIATFPSLYIL